MGSLFSSEEQVSADKTFEAPPRVGADGTLADKEVQATQDLMEEIFRVKQLLATEKLKLPAEADNSSFAYNYEKKTLPLDTEGYVQCFDVEDEKAYKEFYEEYGVVVVRVLDPDDCKRSEDEVWEFMQRHCKGLVRGDPTTYHHWPSLAKLGILGNITALGPQLCENRQNVNIYRVFKTLLGTPKLHGVVGRLSAMRPTKDVKWNDQVVDKPEWKTAYNWIHWDMNMFSGATTCFGWKTTDNLAGNTYDGYGNILKKVQGVLALRDCGPDDGGFHCVPGMHKHIRGWANKNASRKEKISSELTNSTAPTIQVPKDDPLREDVQKVPLRAGCIVIWSSATPHGTFPNDSPDGRVIQYIKMVDAEDSAVSPLFTDRNLLPSGFQLTELGEKVYGFKAW